MKCTIPEISWHNREPVLSIDINATSEKFYRLATGGADCHVLIWQLTICDSGAVKVEPLSDLTRHQKAINSVRWSPAGQYLATADDDANIIIWQLKTDNIPLLEGETNDKEIWIVHKVIRGHKEDIYDLCWSPNGQKLLSGSVDNTAILWDFTKGKSDNILTDHKGFVQGVSWDPKSHYIATISTDRICRIFESSGRQVKARIQKGYLPVPETHYLHNREVKFFHDDTFKSFFRRLDFSPDGSLLAVPSGRVEVEDCKKILNASYIFAVDAWTGPIAIFPSGKQCSTVVRFCPLLLELHEDGPEPIIPLPFRMVLAIGTDHDVILYDTQQLTPFAYFRDIHYTRLTDLTWSKDGLLLIAASTDGFCALITFEPNELGVPYIKEESETEDNPMEVSGCEELDKDESNLDVSKEKNSAEYVRPRKPNLLEKWTIKTPKRNKANDETNIKDTISDNKAIELVPNNIANVNSKRKLVTDVCEDKVVHKIPVQGENESLQKDKESAVTKPFNVKHKESDTIKVSPLVNFLKAGSKDNQKRESKKTVVSSLQPVDVVLDEIEARDAWKCEKNEPYSIESKEMMEVDDYTEEFSLHLQDTTESDEISKKRNENVEPISNLVIENENIAEEAKNSTERSEKQNVKTDDCVQKQTDSNSTQVNKNISEAGLKDCNDSEKINTESHTEARTNKINIPKRRIPLITLSSPKHKKK